MFERTWGLEISVSAPLAVATKVSVNEPTKVAGQVAGVPSEAEATAPVEGCLQVVLASKSKGQAGHVASLATKDDWLAGFEVGDQTDGRGEAITPWVESQVQAKDLEELAMVAREVGEEFVVHKREYTPGLGVCKQFFKNFFVALSLRLALTGGLLPREPRCLWSGEFLRGPTPTWPPRMTSTKPQARASSSGIRTSSSTIHG